LEPIKLESLLEATVCSCLHKHATDLPEDFYAGYVVKVEAGVGHGGNGGAADVRLFERHPAVNAPRMRAAGTGSPDRPLIVREKFRFLG
jgi:hypothetical protein